jgi:hypothetical protein
MNHPKKPISKIVKYFREISVIVIGVAITLFASNLISNRGVKKDIALSMNAIKIELERNADAFEQYAKLLQKSVRYAHYVRTHNKETVDKDSIEYYAYSGSDGIGWGNPNSHVIPITNAFETLKVSGTMRYISNKEILESIWGIYNGMENAQKFIDKGYEVKGAISMSELQSPEGQGAFPLKLFYTLGWPIHMEEICRYMAEDIREVLLKLE